MEFLGYLPFVIGFTNHIYSHPRLGHFLLTSTDRGVQICHVESNLRKSIDELDSCFEDTRKEIITISEDDDLLWFVHFHREWIISGLDSEVCLFKLSEDVFEATFTGKATLLAPLATFQTPNGEKLRDALMDCHLKIAKFMVAEGGDFFVCRNLEKPL
eukprot:TRINITY_DN14285_c0_g1_i1.p1 TRINITY_DN14285_c0_g1~~TRINITY_DN14285_c0_g1_i1.p1  ORF type:complete len:158 (+),score=35.70 TRINITY_DN14285_c0_g1_i1:314-787(+)